VPVPSARKGVRRSPRKKEKMAAVMEGHVEGKENEEKTQTLAEMFEQGQDGIETSRNNNLFQELQGRNLTEKEQEIVNARTAHMQKMLEVYEEREKKRKVEELMVVCPDMTEREVECALEMYDNNEEETAMALVSEPRVKERVRALANGTTVPRAPPRSGETRKGPTPLQEYMATRGPPNPKKFVPKGGKGGIFIGGFRGKRASAGGSKNVEVKAVRAEDQTEGEGDKPATRNSPRKPSAGKEQAVVAAKVQVQAKPARKKRSELKLRSPSKSPCENAKIDDIVKGPAVVEDKAEAQEKPVEEPASPFREVKRSPVGKRTKGLRIPRQPTKFLSTLSLLRDAKAKASPAKKKKEEQECKSEATKSLASNSTLLLGSKNEPPSVKSTDKGKGARRPKAAEGKGKRLQFSSTDGTAKAASPEAAKTVVRGSYAKTGRGSGGIRKKPSLGRVRQKSTKRGTVHEIGQVRFEDGWHNKGYIFPDGFMAKTPFRSSIELDQLVNHECRIVGQGGKFWPAPTFQIVADDRPEEPFYGKSATACWSAILKRINNEIDRRIKEGEDLPPPPKTAIAGPEYFGLNQPDVIKQIEEQDPERRMQLYWAGKMDREEYIASGFVQEMRADKIKPPKAPKSYASGSRRTNYASGSRRTKRKRHNEWSDSEGEDYGEVEEGYGKNRWNSVNRSERYKARCKDRGDKNVDDEANVDNPLPGFIDPITLEPVVNPAISPYGHVMGIATWRAVLDEQGKCPFTKQELSMMKIKTLTKTNIESFRDKIVDLAC